VVNLGGYAYILRLPTKKGHQHLRKKKTVHRENPGYAYELISMRAWSSFKASLPFSRYQIIHTA